MVEKVNLTAEDLTKTTGYPTPLTASLFDLYGNPLIEKPIKFTINGVTYTRDTDDTGTAKLNINLPVGTYPATVTFEGDSTYESASKNVTVKILRKKLVGIHAPNLTKDYGEKKAVTVWIYETTTLSPLVNKDITIKINGVTYNRKTDKNGEAKLNINLPVGEYYCVIDSPENADYEHAQEHLTVRVMIDTHMDGTNIVKWEDETVVYQCAVYSPWERLLNCTVDITVNGKTYTKQTDAEGLAKLNIRLPAGEYQITATFKGNNLYHGSSVSNRIVSKPRIQPLSTVKNGVMYSGNNQGFMESKIMVKQWSPEEAKKRNGITFWNDTGQKFHKEINFTNYEITETDPRVKTAKFTTTEYFDLTGGPLWAYIASPYHENFGGKIIKVDYDKDKGLYTYHCQDGRRQYISKSRLIIEDATIYDILEADLIKPAERKITIPISDEQRIKYAKMLSGLRPIDSYELQFSPIAKAQNSYTQKPKESLAYDTTIDKIMNFAHYNDTPVDVYFSPDGVCQIEPVVLEDWMRTGFKLVHQDLAQYKYSFDTTNILTGISVQTPQKDFVLKDLGRGDDKPFNDWYVDLGYYFGVQIGMISPVTEQVQTEGASNNNSNGGGGAVTGANGLRDNSGANIPKNMPIKLDIDNIAGYAADKQYMEDCASVLRANGYTSVTVGGVGPGTHTADVENAADGTCVITIYGGLCACTMSDLLPGGYLHNKVSSGRVKVVWGINIPSYHANSPSSINPDGRHFDKMRVLPPPWDMSCGGFSIENPGQKLIDSGVHWVYGDTGTQLGENIVKGGGGSVSTGNTESKTKTVIDEEATYLKALEEMSKSMRDLLHFEIKLPLNHPMFKQLHTNQFLWTELPSEFKLGNLEEIFKIIGTGKQNRGIQYMENRWYVEKIVTKMDSNGLFATLTLNVFPSSYSVYANALRDYAKAYDQAFRQPVEEETTGGSSGGVGQPRLGNDCAETNDMAKATGRYVGHAGDNENFDEAAKQGYAQEGKEYYNWARQYKSPIELCKAMANRFTYHDHYNNWYCPDRIHNGGGELHANCYDACRYVKVCMDACGFDCIVVTGYPYGVGHGWNAVKHNGRWYSFDLCYAVKGSNWQGTNSLRCCDEW